MNPEIEGTSGYGIDVEVRGLSGDCIGIPGGGGYPGGTK